MTRTFTKIANPSTTPPGNSGRASWSSNGSILATSGSVSPHFRLYSRSGNVLTAVSGSDRTYLNGTTGVALRTSNDDFVAVAVNYGPTTVAMYQLSGTTLSDFTTPSNVTVLNGATSVSWSPDGLYFSATGGSSPYVKNYQFDGADFTEMGNPDTLPTGIGRSTSFMFDNTYMAVAHNTSPYVSIYRIVFETVIAKVANPSVLPTGTGFGVSWSPDGQYLAVSHGTTPYMTVYYRSGSTFTKLANPTTLPPGAAGNYVAWNHDGTCLAITHSFSPYVSFYAFSGSGASATLTKLPDPASLPAGSANTVSWTNDSSYVAIGHATTPFLTVYSSTDDGAGTAQPSVGILTA